VSQPPGLLGPLDHRPPEPPRPWALDELPQPRWSLPRFWWLNLLLLFLTAVTTTVFGSALVASFAAGRPFDQRDLVNSFVLLLHGDRALAHGLIFSAPLLLILMAHEMGHYVLCMKRRVDATLPYFMPSPTLFGTLGAFIRIKTPIYARSALFDIGSAGPLAGFLMLLPFLFAGVWVSRPLPGGDQNAILIATPLGLRALEWLRFGSAGSGHVLLHPMAIAALAGMLLTAINLLPLGQLDGGHVVYAVFGERWHRIISTCMVALLVVMGKFYFPWWIWAVVMFFFGRRHPLVYDNTPPNATRRWLALATLLIFLVSASLVPTRI
jgi:membrane-associated protease RseP (regulator of RpoE activity)